MYTNTGDTAVEVQSGCFRANFSNCPSIITAMHGLQVGAFDYLVLEVIKDYDQLKIQNF